MTRYPYALKTETQYSDMQKISKTNMKLFARAMEAAERASIQPINTRGAEAVRKGRAGWAAAANLPTRTVAQQWMGWALPARCVPTAATLETRAKLMGTAFKANEIPAAPAPEATAPAPEAAPESLPTTKSAPSTQAPVESPPPRS